MSKYLPATFGIAAMLLAPTGGYTIIRVTQIGGAALAEPVP
jgi:hypothetical protein